MFMCDYLVAEAAEISAGQSREAAIVDNVVSEKFLSLCMSSCYSVDIKASELKGALDTLEEMGLISDELLDAIYIYAGAEVFAQVRYYY